MEKNSQFIVCLLFFKIISTTSRLLLGPLSSAPPLLLLLPCLGRSLARSSCLCFAGVWWSSSIVAGPRCFALDTVVSPASMLLPQDCCSGGSVPGLWFRVSRRSGICSFILVVPGTFALLSVRLQCCFVPLVCVSFLLVLLVSGCGLLSDSPSVSGSTVSGKVKVSL
jgi:hypothetical protein